MVEAVQISPLEATFGAVVTGVKLAGIDQTTWQSVYSAWLKYALLIFPDQRLTREQQVEFARRFGALEFAIAPISNVKADGSLRDETDDDVVKVLKGNMFWHADSTYMPVQAKGAVFSAEVVPNAGGETGWADMRAAYDALDAQTREKVEGLSAYHSLHYSQSKLGHTPKDGSEYSGYGFHDGPVPLRPLVKTHPETGRKSLLIGRHAHNIPGMDKVEFRELSGRSGRICLSAAARLSPSLDAGRCRHLGQQMPSPPRHALGHEGAARYVAQPHCGRPSKRGCTQLTQFGHV